MFREAFTVVLTMARVIAKFILGYFIVLAAGPLLGLCALFGLIGGMAMLFVVPISLLLICTGSPAVAHSGWHGLGVGVEMLALSLLAGATGGVFVVYAKRLTGKAKDSMRRGTFTSQPFHMVIQGVAVHPGAPVVHEYGPVIDETATTVNTRAGSAVTPR